MQGVDDSNGWMDYEVHECPAASFECEDSGYGKATETI
jgi:hypothetical protein